MRLLAIVHYPVFGGPHNQLLLLDGPLRAAGFETTVLLPDEPGNARERLQAGGVEVVTMPLHRLRARLDPVEQARFLWRLAPEIASIRALIRRGEFDIVQIGGLVNPHGAIAARLESKPVVWQLLDTRAPAVVSVPSMLLVRGLADAVLSTGRRVALSHPWGSRLGSRIVPFFPPVDTERFRPDAPGRGEVRAAWGVSDDVTVIGSVANINPQKGIFNLVDAAAECRKWRPGVVLVLVGEEYDTHRAYSALVRSRMRAHGLVEGRDVIFAGGRSDVERQLQGFDVFALGSEPRSEGIPTVILEAMACGLPVVATDVGGVREVVEDGVTGYVVPPRDPVSFAVAVERIVRSPGDASAMRSIARARAESAYTIEHTTSAHVRAYEQAIRRQARRS